MTTDPIVDMFNIIKNAQAISKKEALFPRSKTKAVILKILKREGYIEDFSEEEVSGKPYLKVVLKYDEGRPVISGVERVSKPGRRAYITHREIPRVMDGLGISIVSTPEGMMVGRRARKKKIGGELICKVW